ncbi:GAF domain-containing protein [Celeribacter sp.]|uniref:GAF domain-containing protein n=1 Tax=Celeribacter sp. TaxID=1890673 RepID=UPI003A8EFEBC
MFEYGDPKLTTLAFQLHDMIRPSGVVFYRARQDGGKTLLEVLANTSTPVNQPLERILMPDNTIGHLVVEMGQEIVIDDTLTHPLVQDSGAVQTMGIMAYLGVPCRLGGEVIGGISAVHQHRRHWSASDIDAARWAARAYEVIAEGRLARQAKKGWPERDDPETNGSE